MFPLIFLLLSVFFVLLLAFMTLALIIGAPLVPSRMATGSRMIELLELKSGESFYDLGSGDGRLLIAAAQRGAKAYGVEINPFAVWLSIIRSWLSGVSIKVKWGNLWRFNLKTADKVAVYGIPQMMKRLGEKLLKEARPGVLVVSNAFQIPGLKLVKEDKVGKDRLFLYRISF